MNILQASKEYESWLSRHTPLIKRDLLQKHKAMALSPFPFLRATFYRWAQLWPELFPELDRTPVVLSVGDLHVENFGTWRDAEGRLVWGVNDFDEAFPMPYANDLVRLATSARLAIDEDHLDCDPETSCDAVLEGYTEALQTHGHPFVLAEHDRWLRRLAQNIKRHPALFWTKLLKTVPMKKPPPRPIQNALLRDLPETGVACRFVHREAGVGSLGRQRFALLGEWKGSLVAREAKPLVPSAWVWARVKAPDTKIWYEVVASGPARVPDPFLKVCQGWVLRRLAPDCCRIELGELPEEREELRLLRAMGWEAGNIHLGNSRAIPQIRRDLQHQKKGWLRTASRRMEQATKADWKEWRTKWRRSK